MIRSSETGVVPDYGHVARDGRRNSTRHLDDAVTGEVKLARFPASGSRAGVRRNMRQQRPSEK